MAAERAAWRATPKTLEPTQWVVVDEPWASTARTRQYGRAPTGHRWVGFVPNGPWNTTPCIAALRHTGLDAPYVLDGPSNGPSFLASIPQALVATLINGDIVLIDNLGSHKVQGVREASEAAGAPWRSLPPDTPDFEPIEQACATRKAWLRTVARRTLATLWEAIGDALDLCSPAECSNYFLNAGYHQLNREVL